MEIYSTFKAKEYRMDTFLGSGVAKDVKVRLLVDGVSRTTFDQEKHDHLLASEESERLALAAAENFVKAN